MGNIWWEKILVNNEGKSYWRGKFGKRVTFGAYGIYIFRVSVNIGKKNSGEWLTIH